MSHNGSDRREEKEMEWKQKIEAKGKERKEREKDGKERRKQEEKGEGRKV